MHPNMSFKESQTRSKPVNVQLKTVINPRISFTSLVKPNCENRMYANKTCIAQRLQICELGRPVEYANLDVLIIAFEGVLGSFVPSTLQAADCDTDTLLLRPGLSEALSQLLPYFKIVILFADQSSLHLNAAISALNRSKVPFDAIYKIKKLANDNLFTYHSIMRDLESTSLQALFVTSTMISINEMGESKLLDKANPLMDFASLPIATGMERLVIFCVAHLMTESGLDDDELEKVEHAKDVCDMTAISQTLISFNRVSERISEEGTEVTES